MEAKTYDMATVDGQMERAMDRGLECVTLKATGQRGWVIDVNSFSRLTIRVRLAGKGRAQIIEVPERELTFH
ncbi:hypothetical protein [Streptomyces lydicus]|uniref:hypothetical protein n=1 Tax=Streptomyces lydicus TaxID=47763 RepID=UPI0037AEE6CB